MKRLGFRNEHGPSISGRTRLWAALERHDITLAFSTGRHLQSIEEFYAEKQATRRAECCVCMVGTDIHFREVDESVAKQTTLERVLAQARPDVEALGGAVEDFAPTAIEKEHEVIVAGRSAVCGSPGRVALVDLEAGQPIGEEFG